MIGKRQQRGLFEADHLYMDYVGRETMYGFLAIHRGELFRDEEFAEMYCADNGRPSVAPSLLATALILQTYEQVSDAEAKAKADYDLMDKFNKIRTIQVWQSENSHSQKQNGKNCCKHTGDAKMQPHEHVIRQFACTEKAIQ